MSGYFARIVRWGVVFCVASVLAPFSALATPDFAIIDEAIDLTQDEIEDGVNEVRVLPSMDGGAAVTIDEFSLDQPNAGDVWAHGVTPKMVVAPGKSGIGYMDFGDRGTIFFRLVGVDDQAAASRLGNDVTVGNQLPGIDVIATVSDEQVETFLTVNGDAAALPHQFVYEMSATGGIRLQRSENSASVRAYSEDNWLLMEITAPTAMDSVGNTFPLTVSYDENTQRMTIAADPIAGGAVGDWTVDPKFSAINYDPGDHLFQKLWGPGPTMMAQDYDSGSNLDNLPEWSRDGQYVGSGTNKYNVGVHTTWGLYVGTNASTAISNGQWAEAKYLAPTAGGGTKIQTVNWHATLANSSGAFECRVRGSQANSAWESSSGNHQFLYNPTSNGTPTGTGSTWIAIRLENRSGSTVNTSGTESATKCYTQSGDTLNLELKDSSNPNLTPNTPVEQSAPSTGWYGPNPLDAAVKSAITASYGNVQDLESGSWHLVPIIDTDNGSLDVDGLVKNICSALDSGDFADGTQNRPCSNSIRSGNHSVTLNNTRVPTDGTHRLKWKDKDYAQNYSALSSAMTFKYDGHAPKASDFTINNGPGTTNITSTPTNTSLTANWSGAIDDDDSLAAGADGEVSGLTHYRYCVTSSSSTNCSAPLAGTSISSWIAETTGTRNSGNAVTKSGLTLADGTYHFCVQYLDKAQNYSSVFSCSGDLKVDTTPPAGPIVNDGPGTSDIASQAANNTLTANWTGATDGSGVGLKEYRYCVTTSFSATDCTSLANNTSVSSWISETTGTRQSGNAISISPSSGVFADGTYRICVEYRDTLYNTPAAYACSNGVKVDTAAPTGLTVNDGAGASDIDIQMTNASLTANWTGATDGSGVGLKEYRYCVTTSLSATDCATSLASNTSLSGWISESTGIRQSGNAVSISPSSGVFADGVYRFCVEYRDNLDNMPGGFTCSDGVDIQVAPIGVLYAGDMDYGDSSIVAQMGLDWGGGLLSYSPAFATEGGLLSAREHLVVSPDGNNLYVSDGGDKVYQYEIDASGAATAMSPASESVYGCSGCDIDSIAISPDGEYLAVGDYAVWPNENYVHIFEIGAGGALDAVSQQAVGEGSGGLAWDSSGEYLASFQANGREPLHGYARVFMLRFGGGAWQSCGGQSTVGLNGSADGYARSIASTGTTGMFAVGTTKSVATFSVSGGASCTMTALDKESLGTTVADSHVAVGGGGSNLYLATDSSTVYQFGIDGGGALTAMSPSTESGYGSYQYTDIDMSPDGASVYASRTWAFGCVVDVFARDAGTGELTWDSTPWGTGGSTCTSPGVNSLLGAGAL